MMYMPVDCWPMNVAHIRFYVYRVRFVLEF